MTELILLTNAVLVAVLGGMGRQLYRISGEFKLPTKEKFELKEQDLPSVSVCIPARNEAHALTDSLERVLRSRYPKLEIIVLDDASSDNTTALIKSFASEGVRFIEGSPLEAGWLGKNHALRELLDEASGTFVLFMDIDTRIEPDSIGRVVEYVVTHNVDMVSVLPRREDSFRASVLMSPLRFFWEIIFHRATAPASANNAWLIKRDILLEGEFKGFESVKSTVKPEAKIAAELNKGGKYKFLVGTKWLGFSHEKKWRSQLDTSIRLIYPMLGGKWWMALFAALDLSVMLVPFLVVLIHLTSSVEFAPLVFWPSLAVSLGYFALYAIYTKRVWPRGWLIGAFLYPVLLAQEIILIAFSAVKYARGTVTWKGRPVQLEEKS